MNILVSACLFGVACRYDGKRIEIGGDILRLMERHTLIPFCPEVYGGLTTPREPSEIRDGRVYSRDGRDVTKSFLYGAEQALSLARLYGCTAAVLKARSPSCGSGRIYDGTFSGTLVDGDGFTAALLRSAGIAVYSEAELSALL